MSPSDKVPHPSLFVKGEQRLTFMLLPDWYDRLIIPTKRVRAFDPAYAESLGKQILSDKMQDTAIVVDARDQANKHYKGKWHLVAGRHRVAALMQLGWPIRCEMLAAHEDPLLVEIRENLIRRDLTALDKARHIGAFLERLTKLDLLRQHGGDRKSSGISVPLDQKTTLEEAFVQHATGMKPLKRRQIEGYIKIDQQLDLQAGVLLKQTTWGSKVSFLKKFAEIGKSRQIHIATKLAANPKAKPSDFKEFQQPPKPQPTLKEQASGFAQGVVDVYNTNELEGQLALKAILAHKRARADALSILRNEFESKEVKKLAQDQEKHLVAIDTLTHAMRDMSEQGVISSKGKKALKDRGLKVVPIRR